jgi:hypothetical protein
MSQNGPHFHGSLKNLNGKYDFVVLVFARHLTIAMFLLSLFVGTAGQLGLVIYFQVGECMDVAISKINGRTDHRINGRFNKKVHLAAVIDEKCDEDCSKLEFDGAEDVFLSPQVVALESAPAFASISSLLYRQNFKHSHNKGPPIPLKRHLLEKSSTLNSLNSIVLTI